MPIKADKCLCYRKIGFYRLLSALPPGTALLHAAQHLDVELADLLAQGVAVEPEQRGRLQLIAARGAQAEADQRPLDVLENAVVDPGRRQRVGVPLELAAEMALD